MLFKTDEKISKLGNRLFYKVVKATGELYMLWPLDGGNRQNTEGNETNVIILSIMFYALFVRKALLTDQWNKKSLCITHLSSHLALSAYTMCSSLCLLYSSRTHRPHRWGLGSAFCTVSASASSGLRKKKNLCLTYSLNSFIYSHNSFFVCYGHHFTDLHFKRGTTVCSVGRWGNLAKLNFLMTANVKCFKYQTLLLWVNLLCIMDGRTVKYQTPLLSTSLLGLYQPFSLGSCS